MFGCNHSYREPKHEAELRLEALAPDLHVIADAANRSQAGVRLEWIAGDHDMARLLKVFFALLVVLAVLVAAGWTGLRFLKQSFLAEIAPFDEQLRCHLGGYQLEDGRAMALNRDSAEENALRYTLLNGERGRLVPKAGLKDFAAGQAYVYATLSLGTCAEGTVSFTETGKSPLAAQKQAFVEHSTSFVSGGAKLHGKLVLPPGGQAEAVVIWVAGSDQRPETDEIFWEYLLPAQGIGVFVYDKRGTGKSTGEVSANFHVRAKDTVAAVLEARRMTAGMDARVGVMGGSQGGWVAPLAATQTPVDFVIALYASAEGVTQEDRDLVDLHLREKGYGEDVIARAHELTSATAKIVLSHWAKGWGNFADVKEKYKGEAWFKAIGPDNNYTGMLLQIPSPRFVGPVIGPVVGPALDQDVSFDYDPAPTLKQITKPHLWVRAGKDRTIPSPRTLPILRSIQKRRPNLDVVVYDEADHGLVVRYSDHGQARRRYPDGLIDLIARWIHTGQVGRPIGNVTMYAGSAVP